MSNDHSTGGNSGGNGRKESEPFSTDELAALDRYAWDLFVRWAGGLGPKPFTAQDQAPKEEHKEKFRNGSRMSFGAYTAARAFMLQRRSAHDFATRTRAASGPDELEGGGGGAAGEDNVPF